MYLTHADLIDRPGARELAQIASDEHQQMVPHELMELTLLAATRDGWSDDEIARADNALARIDEAVTRASEMIDGFLVRRYAVPLEEPVPGLVVEWCRQIARFFLHQHLSGDERSDPGVRGYRDALKMLQQVADGKLFLGYNDPAATDGANIDVQFNSDPSVFSRTELGKFR
jgi:phage gp36-like protein